MFESLKHAGARVWHILKITLLVVGLLQLLILAVVAARCAYYHLFAPDPDHALRYGRGSWVVITGGSSGQGKRFALELAERGFSLLLVGSKRSFDVQREIKEQWPHCDVRVVLKDFCRAFEDDFFDSIEEEVKALPQGQVAGLINNVGHRVGWTDFARMPPGLIRNTIACGTITQARMTRMLLPLLDSPSRPQGLRSFLLSVTAQCMHQTGGLGVGMSPAISTPYIGTYEASNAFGFYLASSLYEEARLAPAGTRRTDHLVITPGAVLTQNTDNFLARTPGAISDVQFVKNCMHLLGNVQGTWSGSWAQGLSLWLICLFPPAKPYILHKTGRVIAEALMKRDQSIARKVA